MTQQKPVIHAYSDMFVKYLFGSPGNEGLLLSFINAVMLDSGFWSLTEVTVLNPFNIKEFINDKESILDVKAKDDSKRLYDVEVQVAGEDEFKSRGLYYWAKLYASQIQAGDEYAALMPCIGINVVNFAMFEEFTGYHTCFLLQEKDNPGIALSDQEIVHFLELKKLKGMYPMDKLGKWMYFLKYEGIMDNILERIIKEDPDIAKAHRKFQEFTEDEKLRDLALRREMWQHDQATLRAAAKRRGYAEGHAEGKLADKQEILIRILKNKYGMQEDAVSRVKKVTDLDCLDAAIDAAVAGEPVTVVLTMLRV